MWYTYYWNGFMNNVGHFFNVAYIVTVVVVVLLVVFENRSPLKSISWILIITLIPFAGVVLYFFFGQKYQKQILYNRKILRYHRRVNAISRSQLKELAGVKIMDMDPKIVEKKDIMLLLLNSDRAFLTHNKKVKILNNGSETFAQLKLALSKARHHIHLEFYIFRFDNIGNELFEILKEKSQQGVEVRIIYDSVGSYKIPRKKKKEAKKQGIYLRSFQKVIFPLLSSKVNYRNHRKIAIIDGKTGFTGGINIADRYNEKSNSDHYWRDTFVQIEGNAVNALQAIFLNDWFYVSKENIYNEIYFHEEKEGKNNLTQIISSGPDSNWHAISQFYFSAITSSKNHVYIASPYFIPNDEITFALKAAALRGIDVRILIPKYSDTFISRWSTESYITEMLKAGIKIYHYTKGFLHSKIVISDGVLCSIGSANLDYRSLETNFEVNAVFYDEKITGAITMQYLNDLKHSKKLKINEWKNRPTHKKIASSFARLFAPLM
ncbi:MAG: cardiolipin synthase [Prolixibacteraceae bacterium]|jgi:cardiolipin synthase|nr:cardiolipin synthase [Prolixibacteraceae bacterium]